MRDEIASFNISERELDSLDRNSTLIIEAGFPLARE
jgi:hypothetical protein